MNKFGRQYKLTVELDSSSLVVATQGANDAGKTPGTVTTSGDKSNFATIQLPTTMNFQVARGVSSGTNTASIQVYNLPKDVRHQIFHDSFDTENYKQLTLQVGYDSLSTIFHGSINRAFSTRSGTDIITYIHCFDGGFDTINTKTSMTLDAKNTGDIHKALIGEFPNLAPGIMGVTTEDLGRPVVLEGNTWDLLKTYSNNQCFVDSQKVYILGDNQYFKGSVPLITSANSIIQTPQRERGYFVVETLMEPALVLGQIIKIESSVQPEYNGQYKVVGLDHFGTISGAVNGVCQTTITMDSGNRFIKGLQLVESKNGRN